MHFMYSPFRASDGTKWRMKPCAGYITASNNKQKKISLFKFDVVSYGRRHSSVFNNTIYDYLMESEFDSYAISKQLCRQIDAEIRRKKRIEILMKKFNCGFWFNNNEKTLRFVTLSVSLAYEKNNCLVNETDLISYSNEKITCQLLCHSRLI